MNYSSPATSVECYVSVPSAAIVDENLFDLASLRTTLIRNQRRSLARLRAVQLAVYLLGAAGWIAFIANLVWFAARMPVR
jgi:hypothetical protein